MGETLTKTVMTKDGMDKRISTLSAMILELETEAKNLKDIRDCYVATAHNISVHPIPIACYGAADGESTESNYQHILKTYEQKKFVASFRYY